MIVYYITAHGYGHGVRSCEVISALLRQQPDLDLMVVSALPEAFLQSRLPRSLRAVGGSATDMRAIAAGPRLAGRPRSTAGTAGAGGPRDLAWRNRSFDVGMVQRDSVRIDEDATVARLRELLARWDADVDSESRFLREIVARLVVADIPGIPIEAGDRIGLPTVALGNFSWNWIYEPYRELDPVWEEAVQRFAAAYGRCRLLLRLPFAEPMSAFPEVRDLPLLSEPGRPSREALVRKTGADPEKTWVLVSFTTLDWDEAALDRVRALDRYEFLTVLPLHWSGSNLHAVDPAEFSFRDVLASCDLVLTKPGYGIVSECIVNEKPIIHAERTGFQEYPILVEAIRRHLPEVFLPEADLYAGNLEAALEGIGSGPARPMERGGADEAARLILGRIPPTGP